MKINIDDIPEEGMSLDVTEDGKVLGGLAGESLNYSFLSPVSAHLEINKADGNVFVSGEINARLALDCSRCLKEFSQDYSTSFSVFFTRAREEEREKELKAGDMDVSYLEGPELDTTEVLLGQLSLDLPMQPLCKPECKGLCPNCGADLNLGDCGCSSKGKIDQRFAKLKDFKVK